MTSHILDQDSPRRSSPPRLLAQPRPRQFVRNLAYCTASTLLILPFLVQAECSKWDFNGAIQLVQSNGTTTHLSLVQTGNKINGNASFDSLHVDQCFFMDCGSVRYTYVGSVDGLVNGNAVELTIYWDRDDHSIGVYTGTINALGRVEGTSYDRSHPATTASWYSYTKLGCLPSVPLPPPTPPSRPVENHYDPSLNQDLHSAQPTSVRATERVRVDGASAAPPKSICDSARVATARNSPAAPVLDAQCRAAGAAGEAPVDLDALSAKGGSIANQDPLAEELRYQQPNDSSRRGFDIGMAVAEGQTRPGPGKERIRDLLPPDEKQGFIAAVAFTLERNKYAQQAASGATIAAADPSVAEVRDVETDVFYRLGFDIATGIFGNPALGAQGNTAPGSGSMGIRDVLSAAARAGFNASMAMHLSRDYAH